MPRQTPTPEPSKSYAVDFKGQIAAKFFLSFRRLSVPIRDTERLTRLAAKSTVNRSISCRPNRCHRAAASCVLNQLGVARAESSGYFTGNKPEVTMGSSQKRAIRNCRSRLSERGLARFEVLGRDADRDFIRSLARPNEKAAFSSKYYPFDFKSAHKLSVVSATIGAKRPCGPLHENQPAWPACHRCGVQRHQEVGSARCRCSSCNLASQHIRERR